MNAKREGRVRRLSFDARPMISQVSCK